MRITHCEHIIHHREWAISSLGDYGVLSYLQGLVQRYLVTDAVHLPFEQRGHGYCENLTERTPYRYHEENPMPVSCSFDRCPKPCFRSVRQSSATAYRSRFLRHSDVWLKQTKGSIYLIPPQCNGNTDNSRCYRYRGERRYAESEFREIGVVSENLLVELGAGGKVIKNNNRSRYE